VWDKTEYSSTLSRTRRMMDELVPDVDPMALRKARESAGLLSAATSAIAQDRQHEAETLSEFIDKKREMFLVQMSLDIKREETSKLEATAAADEEGLRKAEVMLEEDAIRFDAFLKQTDASAHEALKEAEAMARVKADKLHELKKLKHGIASVTAEKARLREALDEFRRYKAFLDGLTPKEWIEERYKEQMQERERRRAANLGAKVGAWEEGRALKVAEFSARAEVERKRALKLGQQPPKADVQALVTAAVPPCPVLADEALPELSEEERELPMYFTKPEQLAAIFEQLEESNLFLIQNCQDTEQQLEELRALHEETSASMVRQTAALELQMAGLHATLMVEETKAAALRQRGSQENEDEGVGAAAAAEAPVSHAQALDKLLPALRTHIVDVYERCGFKANASSDTVGMLTQLEGALESLLTSLTTLEPEYVAMKEREKERDRRTRVREARMTSAAELHEAKQRKMLERAQAPVQKRMGKPIAYRSVLPHQPRTVAVVDPEEAKREEEKFFS
jgi:hypothetical protein